MTDVLPFNRKTIAIEWRVRERDNHLGIIDVVVEDVSMLVARRQAGSDARRRRCCFQSPRMPFIFRSMISALSTALVS